MKGPQELKKEENVKTKQPDKEQMEDPSRYDTVERYEADESDDSPLGEHFSDHDLNLKAVAREFGMEDREDIISNRARIQRLVRWAQEQGAKNRLEIAATVRKARKHLGDMNIYDLSSWAGMQLDKND